MRSELCHQELGYDFVNYIAEAYKPEMIYSSGVRNFGNEDNEWAIYLSRHSPFDEEECDNIYDGVVDGILEFLIEYGRETVWTWGFKVMHTEKSGFDLIMRGNSTQLSIFILCDARKEKMFKVRKKINFILLKQILEMSKESFSDWVTLSNPWALCITYSIYAIPFSSDNCGKMKEIGIFVPQF